MDNKAFQSNQLEIRLIAVSGGTNLIKLGLQPGLAAQKPEYPEFFAILQGLVESLPRVSFRSAISF